MKTKFKKVFALLFLLGIPFSAAQGALVDSSKVVGVQIFPSAKPAQPGSVVHAAVIVQIQDGWHINAHEGLLDFLIPANLTLDKNSVGTLTQNPAYPAGTKKSLAGLSQPFAVYEKAVTFYADIKLSSALQPGEVKLPFKLQIQACNDQSCLSPTTFNLELPLEAGLAGQASVPFHPELFQSAEADKSNVPEDNTIERYLQSNGILLTFVLIFLGGLALNLTPCVYPMIPLTISYFGNQKSEKPTVILGRAIAYVCGISITYSALGVTAALTGKILGSSLQSPWVLAGISAVLVTLSLSMFGVYEIQAPSWLLNRIASTSTQGWLGALG
ncbi:MAG TPA: cytochrome c biogenesis protein CcdA, partial [bacterium]|nr:cytochrome c biogenesis protein CcdA [bacterium]